MAQVALQPQLSSVFEQLCQHHGQHQVKFHTMQCPEQLWGKPFRHARKAFPTATLAGLVDSATGGLLKTLWCSPLSWVGKPAFQAGVHGLGAVQGAWPVQLNSFETARPPSPKQAPHI